MKWTATIHLPWWGWTLWIFLALACSPERGHLAGSRPNIVLIMADDLGYSDLGIHGNSLVETPHLDALAGESVQFSQFYVTPVCASTRASLLTGRHFLRTGVSHVHGGKDFLHLDEVTLAEELKKAGYATGMWGKWHSGKTPGYYPWERGFDEAFMAALYTYEDNQGLYNGRPRSTEGWVTEVITDEAIDFIRRHREGPFFAYLPYLSCHAPLVAPEAYVSVYRHKGLSENLSTLYGMVEHLDHHIGRLLQNLQEMGLSENTIVLFLSDNGPAVINNYLSDADRKTRYVNGFRGHKGNIWENGIKSPLFVRWKGHFRPGKVDYLSEVCDLFPTLMEWAGAGDEALDLDGQSIASYCLPGSIEIPGKEIFLYASPGWPPTDQPWTPEGVKDEYRPWKYIGGDNLSYENQIIGIRKGNHKLLMNPGITDGSVRRDEDGYVLINMEEDPREETSLLPGESALALELQSRLKHWYKDVYSSPHAFEMPVFRIDSSCSSCPVLAYAPRRTSATVKSAAGYLSGFHRAGDWAEYELQVQKAGPFDMQLSYVLNASEALPMALQLGTDIVEFQLEPGKEQVDLYGLPLSKESTQIALSCPAGLPEGQLKLYTMTFTKNKN